MLDPFGWAVLRQIKSGDDSNESLLGADTTDASKQLLSLPVTATPAMSPGDGLVLGRSAVVSAVGPVRVAVSEHTCHANDSVGLRCTWRIGWNVVRPDRIGRFPVEGSGAS